jgi:hypothetical protein
LQEGQPL